MKCVALQRNTALVNAHSIEDVERILSDAEEQEPLNVKEPSHETAEVFGWWSEEIPLRPGRIEACWSWMDELLP